MIGKKINFEVGTDMFSKAAENILLSDPKDDKSKKASQLGIFLFKTN